MSYGNVQFKWNFELWQWMVNDFKLCAVEVELKLNYELWQWRRAPEKQAMFPLWIVIDSR